MSRLLFDLIKASPAAIGCTSTEKFVLLSYVDALNPEQNGTLAWPGRKCIARQTGFNEKTVRRAIERLCELELIKFHHRGRYTKVFAVNVGLISRLIRVDMVSTLEDRDRMSTLEAPEWAQCPPRVDTVPIESGHGAHITTNRTTKVTTKISPVGGSDTLRVSRDPVQRQLAVHGLATAAANAMRADRQEPPTEEKKREGARTLAAGARAVRERPG